MSQRDLVAELRATRIAAPAEVRERVRLIAAADTSTREPRFTWRRALVVVLPVAAAVAATVVFTRPSHQTAAPVVPTTVRSAVAHGSVAVPDSAAKLAPSTSAGTGSATAIPVAPSRARVQRYGAELSLRVPTPDGVSTGVKRALRIATALGGHPTSVHATSLGRTAHADLVLKIPRVNVQRAVTQLSQLGAITGEQVDVQDLQAGLDSTGRTIGRLQKQLTVLRAQPQTPALTRQIAALTARVVQLQRARANTIRTAHFATVNLHLRTPSRQAVTHHEHHGPFAWLLRSLVWLGIGTVYVLVLGIPLVLLGLLVALIVRTLRRRREDALLSRT